MKKKLSSSVPAENSFTITGTVRNRQQQPVPKIIVRAYNKGIRNLQLLGEATTDGSGIYAIHYIPDGSAVRAVIIQVFDTQKKLLKESGVQYSVPALLQMDIAINDAKFDGMAEFDQLVKTISPFAEDVLLSELTDTDQHDDISFIVEFSGQPKNRVEQLAMAFRFEQFTTMVPDVWYGMLRMNLPLTTFGDVLEKTIPGDFESRLDATFDALMHTRVDVLMEGVQKAIEQNIIAASLNSELKKIKEQLKAQILAYAKQHPVSGGQSALHRKAQLGGLKGTALQLFIELHNNHAGTEDELWEELRNHPDLANNKNIDRVKAVFHLARLTDSLSLTEQLIKAEKIKTSADIKKLVKYDQSDWAALMNGNNASFAATGNDLTVDAQTATVQLEASLAKAFPTAAFAAKLEKDSDSKLPHRDKISQFLQKNEHFDLLHDHVGKFIKESKGAVAEKDAPELAQQLRRVQRVFKLAPDYNTTNLLLNDNMHSAHQVYKMGQDNFVATYGKQLGEKEATQVFQKASEVHASAVALIGNLKSLADASAMNAFPNFSELINQQLVTELPSLETLFGNTDFCECAECSSVYGAPAYLTDILHFLDQRDSTLPGYDKKKLSVKELLLRRRPDIGHIDLECNNTNTEVPYIDIACEIMEDYMASPQISVGSNFTINKGPIGNLLLAEIKNQFAAAGYANVSGLLTANAKISAPYLAEILQADNSFERQQCYIVRDKGITFRLINNLGTGEWEVRLLHQTYYSSEAISAGPEYVNVKVYNDFLKTAKRPFALPFDLFETEGRSYLEKLGVKKADLIDVFRKEDKLPPGLSPADIQMAFAWLDINEAEQALIFQPDPTHQSLYWGAAASVTSIQVDVFENLSGLNYQQILDLLAVTFVNHKVAPFSVIEHDDLSSDTTKKRIIHITPAKLDAMHRFLRLWRKTAYSMQELSAIIMSLTPSITVDNRLAWTLQQFALVRQSLRLSVFEVLAFFKPIEPGLYDQLFQNGAVTNPVNPDFARSLINAQSIAVTDTHKSVIAAVLHISLEEVNALFAKTTAVLSLANISFVYRHVLLARSLHVSVADLLTLLNVAGPDPFLDIQSTWLFIKKYKLLQSSGFSVDELNYILRHHDNRSQSLVPSASQVATALDTLQDQLSAVSANLQIPVDPQQLLTKWIADPILKWDSSIMNRLVDILVTIDENEYKQKISDNSNFLLNLRTAYHDPFITVKLQSLPFTQTTPATPIVFPASIVSQLSYDAQAQELRLAGYMNEADLNALKALSSEAAWQGAVTLLYNKSQQTDSGDGNLIFFHPGEVEDLKSDNYAGNITNRFYFFIDIIGVPYRTLLQRRVLGSTFSTWFRTDHKVVDQLLQSVPEIVNAFTHDSFISKIPLVNDDANPYPVQASRYQFVAKICFIVNKLKLTDTDLSFLLAHADQIGSLNLLNLPVAAIPGAVTTFAGFETLINLLRFQQYYPAKVNPATGATIAVSTILLNAINEEAFPGDGSPAVNAARVAALIQNLVTLTGWKETDLSKLIASPDYLGLGGSVNIKSIPFLFRLRQCFHMLAQSGISADDAINWSKPSLTVADASNIKQTLKSIYSNSDWLQVTKPLQDALREKKRDALIAYLLANPGTQTWKDENDLYSYFLLDVEMCSCQPASRIVEATNAVQLFVQRCFLNLENAIVVNSKEDGDWLQWKWMKNFRVWQANMKVFLYPENWIEPELIPDDYKSPFLKDLENELLQNEVTAINVEDAFQNYLEKLDDVARLEVKGMYYDHPTKTLHVFARTFGGNPKIYYYRRFINSKRWTPWTRVDLDITSDHIIPAVYNNRLYIFWAVFSEDAQIPDKVKVPGLGGTDYTLEKPAKNWTIQLAFSEYKNGRWAPKTISEYDIAGQIKVEQKQYPDKRKFVFTALDIPSFGYDKIFGPNGNPVDQKDVFNTKVANAIRQNGKLVISCYYFSYIGPNSFDNYKYVSSFQLDPVKGYPTQLKVDYKIRMPQANVHKERTNSTSELINMLDAQTFIGVNPPPPPSTGIPGSGPGSKIFVSEQAGGPFNNLIPMQWSLIDRSNFMINIYEEGLNAGFHIQSESGIDLPYFFQDMRRSYFIMKEFSNNKDYEFGFQEYLDLQFILLEEGAAAYQAKFDEVLAKSNGLYISRYFNFHHPLVDHFVRRLFTTGIDGLMDRETQLKGDFGFDPEPAAFNFVDYFKPVVSGFNDIYNGSLAPVTHNGVVDTTPGYPKDDVDFSLQSGYGLYNWELFFHAPLMIAERLSQNQQFEDASRWYNYIFNPMDTSIYASPAKFWNTKPFFLNTQEDYFNQRIENVLKGINSDADGLVPDVTDWRNNPFQPHFIAQYRTVAYQKAAVMKYVAHLVRHGDYLFRQHTRESVNEATQLYILAAEILGPKPELVPSPVTTGVNNYNQLAEKLDALSDAMIDIENLLPQNTIKGYNGVIPNTPLLPNLKTLYFCIPMNENMAGPTGYWDTVADRLFKIRHCLDIDGAFAPLSLFSPAIDPAMLVRAAAAGLDIGSILNDVNTPLPSYRFMVMVQKAAELCHEVKSLGAVMLSALEKKDAESLALLRSGQEIKLLDATLLVKEQQKMDAQAAIDNLDKQKELIDIRQQYYHELVQKGLSAQEVKALDLMKDAKEGEKTIKNYHYLNILTPLLPTANIGIAGAGGTPNVTGSWGGSNLSQSASNYIAALSSDGHIKDKTAAITNNQSGYNRRSEEWQNQLNLANKELQQVEKQQEGAKVRMEIAKLDLKNLELQIAQAREANDFMRSKYTNEELFSWMITQVSTTYFRSYQLAYDIAKKTERCFRYELGLTDSNYINFGYWDSLKKGLLAGEQLLYDIKKMEMAYYEQNKRELELTKHISLSQLDAQALLQLKTNRACWITLPEELFDMDYPGHYMRRIKSVSITIPCITGPYTTVSTRLTMTRNSVRISGIAGDAAQYPRKLSSGIPADDPRFRDSVGALQSMATSNAQNDSGLFELNFRDERYLPFEGAGAISMWHLQLPAAIEQFDYNTISDVIIHLKYTARDGGEALKTNAAESLVTKINQMLAPGKNKGLMRFFSAKNDLPTEWYRFLHPVNATDDQVLTLNLDQSRFPLFVQGKTIKITSVELVADSTVTPVNNIQLIDPSLAASSLNLTDKHIYGNWLSATADYSDSKKDTGTWFIKNPVDNPKRLTDSDWNNLVVIVHYEIG
jgi:hypothetical protein